MSTQDTSTQFTLPALPTAPDPTSKNSQKKKAKLERAAAAKAERKAREKERKAEKRKAREENNAENSTKTTDLEAAGQPKQKKRRLDTREKFKANVVVDLGFDNLMFERVTRFLSLIYSVLIEFKGNDIHVLSVVLLLFIESTFCATICPSNFHGSWRQDQGAP